MPIIITIMDYPICHVSLLQFYIIVFRARGDLHVHKYVVTYVLHVT